MSRLPDRAAVIIAVGDEVLGGYIQDSNSHWLAQTLRAAGWPLRRIEVVGDVEEEIIDAVRRAVADPRVARVLVSGGLGPTPDDLTLAAVARALGRPLEVNQQALLPGVPRELKAIVEDEAIPRLFAGRIARTVIELRYQHAIEAQFTEPMEIIGVEFPEVKIGSYPQSETRELVIRISGDDAGSVEAAAARVRELRPGLT